jgi:hypothetical protein
MRDLLQSHCHTYEETTIITAVAWNIKRMNTPWFYTASMKPLPLSPAAALKMLGFGHITAPLLAHPRF